MKESDINFKVFLDDGNIPEKIEWNATDTNFDKPKDTRAISIATWDHATQNSLRMDLWTKQMTVEEIKRFYIDCVGGLGQSLMNATGDEFMASEMTNLCEKLVEYLKKSEGK